MAAFHDHLNRTVLHVNLLNLTDRYISGNIALVFQENKFIDNTVGWRIEELAVIKVNTFLFSRLGVDTFIENAQSWLNLPIRQLGETYFSGMWELGHDQNNYLSLLFQPVPGSQSKTDWFNLEITFETPELNWKKTIHTDYSCLRIFIEELSPKVLN